MPILRARDNPFATQRVLRLRYEFPSDHVRNQTRERLKSLGFRAAIVGHRGSGKTTLLEDLGQWLGAEGFRTLHVFLNEQNRAIPMDCIRRIRPQLTDRDIVLLDGCEQLGPINWWRFRWQTRQAGGLIITTHHAGRLPTLWRCETNVELLAGLIRKLQEVPLSPSEVERLYQKHRGNVREALRELYDMKSISGPAT